MLGGFFRYLREHWGLFGGYLAGVLQPFLENIAKNGGQLLMDVAYDAVKAVQNDPSILSNSQKRDAALDIILNRMKNEGVAVATSAANGALEAMLAKLKADTGK